MTSSKKQIKIDEKTRESFEGNQKKIGVELKLFEERLKKIQK